MSLRIRRQKEALAPLCLVGRGMNASLHGYRYAAVEDASLVVAGTRGFPTRCLVPAASRSSKMLGT